MAPSYSYEVRSGSGQILTGVIEAFDQQHAYNLLSQRGDTIIDLGEAESLDRRLKLETRIELNDRELSDFVRELQALISSGATLPKALGVLADSQGPKRTKALARDLKLQLELGDNASELLSRSKSSGAQMLGRFMYAAEAGGRIDVMLAIASDFLEQRSAAMRDISSALAYPLFLSLVSVLAIGFLIIYVTPSIAPLFESGEAPVFIRLSAVLGAWVQTNLRLVLIAAAALLVAIFFLIRSYRLKMMIGAAVASAPGIRPIADDLDYGPVGLAYGALLKSGWPAEPALRLASELSSGRAGAALANVAAAIRDGATLTDGFAVSDRIPHEFVRAIEIGEASGSLPTSVTRVSEHLIARAIKRLQTLAGVLAPVMIVAIGGFVAWLMLTLLSSISSLGDAVL